MAAAGAGAGPGAGGGCGAGPALGLRQRSLFKRSEFCAKTRVLGRIRLKVNV